MIATERARNPIPFHSRMIECIDGGSYDARGQLFEQILDGAI